MNKSRYLDIRKRANLERKLWALPLHMIQDLLLVGVTSWLCMRFPESWPRFGAVPLLSILIFRNFSLMHEAVHGLASKNKLLNTTVGLIAGAICFLPFEPWKRVHLEHHYWSGNIEKDPVMAIVKNFPSWPPALQKTLDAVWRSWIPLMAFMQNVVFWIASARELARNPLSLAMALSVALPLAAWGLLISALSHGVLLSILLPAVLLYLVAVEVVNFPHHLELAHFRDETRLPAWEQHSVTRSCVYPRWLAKFVAMNFNYHTEHHLFPDAPWYRLEELHHTLERELKSEYNSDLQFDWIMKNKAKPLTSVLKPRKAEKKAA